ncbi:MAG: glycosyl transferase, partial [Gemmatimonadetes bacterium]|nr:glycosyl transferase [Gemmatimonadota bacterium]
LFAAIALLADRTGGPGLLIWLMTGGVFLGDATLTLVRRMLRGERWYAAHKSHAYQRAVQSGWSHQRVSAAALFLCLVGAGLGWVALRYPAWQWWAVATEGALLLGVYLLVETRAPMRPA